MSAHETCLRIALAMMAADRQACIPDLMRTWIVQRVQDDRPFPQYSIDTYTPLLLDWADARNPKLGATLRRVLEIDATPTPAGQSALAVLAQYPGTAAREQAAVLAGQEDAYPTPPEKECLQDTTTML